MFKASKRTQVLNSKKVSYTLNKRVDDFNPLYSRNPLTFTNSEDPDEMKHDAAFHQDLHCLYR